MKDSTHQRVGAISNTHVGREFEDAVQVYFGKQGIDLSKGFSVPIGHETRTPKNHKFDLGSADPPVLIECKAITWTKSGKRPSAKIRGMNEAMLLFHLAPATYRKLLVVQRHMHPRRTEDSLAAHYIRTQLHLVPNGIEVWQFDLSAGEGERLL